MFKRITRRQKRQAVEDALGLDEDEKQVLGLNDTDSSESSDSDSESDADSGAEGADDLDELEGAQESASEQSNAEESDGDEEGDGTDSEDGSTFDESPPSLTTEDALKDPIYAASSDGTKACAVCPGKLLKTADVVKTHILSTAHVRRHKKFCEAAKSLDNPSTDPSDILKSLNINHSSKDDKGSEVSKRAEKRKLKLDALKKKRQAQRDMRRKAKRKRDAQRTEEVTATEQDVSPQEKDTKETIEKKKKKKQKKEKKDSAAVEKPDSSDEPPAARTRSQTPTQDKARRKSATTDTLTNSGGQIAEAEAEETKSKKRKRKSVESHDTEESTSHSAVPPANATRISKRPADPEREAQRKKRKLDRRAQAELPPRSRASSKGSRFERPSNKHVRFPSDSKITKFGNRQSMAPGKGGILTNHKKTPVRYFDESREASSYWEDRASYGRGGRPGASGRGGRGGRGANRARGNGRGNFNRGGRGARGRGGDRGRGARARLEHNTLENAGPGGSVLKIFE